METNTNWAGIIGSLVRFALGGAAGALVTKGVFTPEQGEFLLVAASAAAVTVAGAIWIWVKNRAEEKLKDTQIQIALNAASTTPISVVKADAAAKIANQ